MAFYGNGANITSIPSPASLTTASGSAPSYSARAFVKYNHQNNTVIYQKNISSVTDNATGVFTVNLSTGMPTADHVPVANCSHEGFGGQSTSPNRNNNTVTSASTSSCVFATGQANVGYIDCINYVVFFA